MKERIYDANDLKKLGVIGREAREDFRNRANAQWETKGNTHQQPEENPYRRILNELTTNRTPRGREVAMVERYTRLADERDREMQTQAEKLKAELLRDADPRFQVAKEHYLSITNLGITCPEDARDLAAATAALQEWKKPEEYWRHANAIAERRLDSLTGTLNDARTNESSAVIERARLEAEAARLNVAILTKPPGSPAESSEPSA